MYMLTEPKLVIGRSVWSPVQALTKLFEADAQVPVDVPHGKNSIKPALLVNVRNLQTPPDAFWPCGTL